MGKSRKPKAQKIPFPLVSSDEKSTMDNYSEHELNGKIAEVAKNDAALMDAKKLDQDLNSLREKLAYANGGYTDAHKANLQRIGYARRCLRNKGKDAGTSSIEPKAESQDE